MRERTWPGGSMDNAIGLDEFRVLTEAACATPTSSCATRFWTGRRPVLAGHAIIGAFEGFKSGMP